jgi:hypothetical protein
MHLDLVRPYICIIRVAHVDRISEPAFERPPQAISNVLMLGSAPNQCAQIPKLGNCRT